MIQLTALGGTHLQNILGVPFEDTGGRWSSILDVVLGEQVENVASFAPGTALAKHLHHEFLCLHTDQVVLPVSFGRLLVRVGHQVVEYGFGRVANVAHSGFSGDLTEHLICRFGLEDLVV